DMSDLHAELAGHMDEAEWEWLMPHADRGALVIVSPDLDLVDVGAAIANDDTEPVQGWINQRLLCKPTQKQIKTWSDNPQKRFKALILQPYVLIQDVA
ncbi:MAG: DUF2288 domain-containing protein, partial [Cyanobacteria bacterium J06638_20]